MRKGMAVLIGASMLGGLLLANAKPSLGAATHKARPRAAASHVSVIEKSLLGIRMLASYKTVLNLYGQPSRVYRNGEFPSIDYSLDANGNETGGIRGFIDSSSATPAGRPGGGPGMPGGMPGMPSGMPGGGMPGMRPGGGGMPGMPSGMPGGGGMPGMRPGGAGMPGMSPGGSGGLNGAADASGEQTFAQSGGFTWLYFYPKQELLYEFHFNGDGRVEIISESGRYLGKLTSRGISLGDAAKNVYNAYGWPDETMSQAVGISLNYNIKRHVQFGVLNNKVINIVVALREDQVFRIFRGSQGGGTGGAPGMPGGGGRGGGKNGGGGPRGGGGGGSTAE